MARDGVPKACLEQAAANARGSPTCVCWNIFLCEVGRIVQGDEGHISEVAQVLCHGVIVEVGHQEEEQEEEVEKQREVEGKRNNSRATANHG